VSLPAQLQLLTARWSAGPLLQQALPWSSRCRSPKSKLQQLLSGRVAITQPEGLQGAATATAVPGAGRQGLQAFEMDDRNTAHVPQRDGRTGGAGAEMPGPHVGRRRPLPPPDNQTSQSMQGMWGRLDVDG